MKENPKDFSSEYFATNYRNYVRQNPPAKMDFYRELVEKHLTAPADPRVLDLGCAFGRFLGFLPERWRRFGIDISEFAVSQASRSSPAVRFAVASASAVPFAGPFDTVVAFDVIEHVPDLEGVAAFINRGLAPDGTFIFVVPVYDGPLGGVVRALDKDPTHVHKQSREFWLEWAGRHFEILEWTGVFRYLLPVGPYINWPVKALRRISPAIAVVVKPDR